MSSKRDGRGGRSDAESAQLTPPSARGPASSEVPVAGDVIASKYKVIRVLGVGGMGVVVAAHHLDLNITVAIKFLIGGSLESPNAVERFRREGRAAARIANEHVARVFDVGTLETGAPFIVMEFLDGVDLATRLTEGPLLLEEAVECLLQTCEVLAEAHAMGIVHRDLKPANLFCVRRPSGLPWIKVLDFGISKVLPTSSSPQMSMTRSATIMGSPLYMSPEQMQSTRAVDARSDIWALGVILYEVLAGRPPFVGETLPEACINIATQPPPGLRTFRPDCPLQVEEIVMRCLAKDPKDRYDNVAELAIALEPFGSARARASVERITRTGGGEVRSGTGASPPWTPGFGGSTPGSGGETRTAMHTDGDRRSARRSIPTVAGIVAGVCVLAAAAFAFVSMRKNDVTPTEQAVTPAAEAPGPATSPFPVPYAAAPAGTEPPVAAPAVATDASVAPRPPSPPRSSPPLPALPGRPKPVRPPAARPAPSVGPAIETEHDVF